MNTTTNNTTKNCKHGMRAVHLAGLALAPSPRGRKMALRIPAS